MPEKSLKHMVVILPEIQMSLGKVNYYEDPIFEAKRDISEEPHKLGWLYITILKE